MAGRERPEDPGRPWMTRGSCYRHLSQLSRSCHWVLTPDSFDGLVFVNPTPFKVRTRERTLKITPTRIGRHLCLKKRVNTVKKVRSKLIRSECFEQILLRLVS